MLQCNIDVVLIQGGAHNHLQTGDVLARHSQMMLGAEPF